MTGSTTAPHGGLAVADAGPVRTFTIARPEAMNALDRRVFERLEEELARLASDGVRAVVIAGAGERAFSAGADLDELAGLSAEQAHAALALGQRVLRALAAAPVPTIAAVNGHALGGGFELALACSFIVAAERATFGLPETGLGLIPGYGGTQRLPALVGAAVARRLVLTGERVRAQRAWELGIVSEPPVADDALAAHAADLAAGIAARGPLATRLALEAVRERVPAAALDHELALAALATGSREAGEGVAAFRERRAPDFGGVAAATAPDGGRAR